METRRKKERWRMLVSIERLLDPMMIVLGLVWLALAVMELMGTLTPVLERIVVAIWIIFIADFLLGLLIAPDRLVYLKRNWLNLIALAVPAFRGFRILRALRGMRLVRLVTSLNRGIRALSFALRRHGFAYVLAATMLVVFAGAAGMYAFERDVANTAMNSYGYALWWTAMLVTTIGSDYWPRTTEGRVLCLMLGLYSFSVLGYITATLASLFLGDRRPIQPRGEPGHPTA
jgi:voltage-gated potassium channel